MLWSRLLFFLVTLALGVVAVGAVVLPPALAGLGDREVEAALVAGHRGAWAALAVQSRKWLDAAAQVSVDEPLVEALAEASRSGPDNPLLRRSARERLRHFNREWQADFLIAVDGEGRVLARLGHDEERWGDELSGAPIVAEALRGYQLDDHWREGGAVFRVVAAPVHDRERYVGCLIVGHSLGAQVVEHLRAETGVGVALLVPGQVVAADPPSPDLAALLGRLGTGEAAAWPTEAQPTGGEPPSRLVVIRPLPGEAGEGGAALALHAPRRSLLTPALIRVLALAIDPRRLPQRPLAVVAGGALGLVLLFVLVSWLEHRRRVVRLLAEVQRVAHGDPSRLDDRRHHGIFGRLAKAINHALELQGRAHGPRVSSTSGAGRSFGSVAMSAPATAPTSSPRSRDPLPATDGDGAAAASLDLAVPEAPVAVPPTATPAAFREANLSLGLAPMDSLLGGVTQRSAAAPSPPAAEALAPPAPAPPLVSALDAALDPIRPGAGARGGPPVATLGCEEAPTPSRSAREALAPTLPGLGQGSAVAGPPVAAAIDPADGELERRLVEVFHEYVATRRACGEEVATLTVDRFVAKLRLNRRQMMERLRCPDVHFHVYVKDGKAAVRATPTTR